MRAKRARLECERSERRWFVRFGGYARALRSGLTASRARSVSPPVENSRSDAELEAGRTACRAICNTLYGVSDLGEPHTSGECMDCQRDRLALWIYGDFVLCPSCIALRRRVRADLEAGRHALPSDSRAA